MENIIYKIDVPECSSYTYEVGMKGVVKIEQDIIQTGVGDGYNTSKLIYRIIFDDKRKIEISANIKGIIIFRKNVELAESEDKKIRKELIEIIKEMYGEEGHYGLTQRKVNLYISWLEKQGEQKPSWNERDEKNMNTIINVIHGGTHLAYENEINWLESLKNRCISQPKQEWSEYDKIQLSEAIQMIEANGTWIRSEDAVKKVSNWLKSLKPNHWRSNEYDISLLEEIARNIRNNIRPFCSEVSSLEALIDTLKNL